MLSRATVRAEPESGQTIHSRCSQNRCVTERLIQSHEALHCLSATATAELLVKILSLLDSAINSCHTCTSHHIYNVLLHYLVKNIISNSKILTYLTHDHRFALLSRRVTARVASCNGPVHLFVCCLSVAKIQERDFLKNKLEPWSLLTTYRKSYMGFPKNPLREP